MRTSVCYMTLPGPAQGGGRPRALSGCTVSTPHARVYHIVVRLRRAQNRNWRYVSLSYAHGARVTRHKPNVIIRSKLGTQLTSFDRLALRGTVAPAQAAANAAKMSTRREEAKAAKSLRRLKQQQQEGREEAKIYLILDCFTILPKITSPTPPLARVAAS